MRQANGRLTVEPTEGMSMIDAQLRERVLRALRDAALVDAAGAPPSSAVNLTLLGGGLSRRSVLAGLGARRFVVRVSDETRIGALELPVRSEEHTSELQSRENLVC